MIKTIFHPAKERGNADHGWLNAHHSFSFASYNDPSKVHFGALRVLNDDIVAPGMGFGKHPHDNMEIITIVLRGALEHQDSMGHTEAIHENEVQVMSAGTGVFHSEYNHNKDKDVNLLQVWIFPEKKNVKPAYGQRVFALADRINKLQTLVSPVDKDDEGLKINQQTWIYRTNLQKGQSLEHSLHTAKHGTYIFVIEGSVSIDNQTLEKRDAIGISEASKVKIAAEADSDFIILEVPMVF